MTSRKNNYETGIPNIFWKSRDPARFRRIRVQIPFGRRNDPEECVTHSANFTPFHVLSTLHSAISQKSVDSSFSCSNPGF